MVTTIKPLLLSFSIMLLGLVLAVKADDDLTTDIGSKRFLIKTGKKLNWYQANHACTRVGMTLASIESETEQTNLRNYLFSQGHLSDGFWLSGNNLADETVYTWLSNGNKLSYTNWLSGQPSPLANYCVFTDVDFKWNTVLCAGTTPDVKYYICSRPLVPNCGITGRCKINRSFYY
ncbi:C-type lectin 37Db-like [Lucilia sericata]|uniref:C-type lectin 37Db-like n=1 Tax=Lucilia sericata TaxID=13632 RepID=UPI0018A871E0|nr:C-type lectin 37Db-like [Lucilia sericata]